MFKRSVIIFLAFAVAAVVLFLSLLADKSDSKRDERTNVEINTTDPWHPPNPNQTDSGQFRATGESSHVYVRTKNDRGQIFVFSGDSFEPLTEAMNEIQMTKPMARIHLKPGERVMEIRADEGVFIAPDLQPRSGDFQGNVVVTLFETKKGEKLSLAQDSPNVVLRVFLEEASFDIESGSIEGDGEVMVTGERFEFLGKGLRMTYNEVRRRLQELIITRGRELRMSRHAGERSRTEASESKAGQPAQPSMTGTPMQYYRAVFHDQVTVQTDAGRVANCDTLEVTFGTRRNSKDDNMLQQFRTRKKNARGQDSGEGKVPGGPGDQATSHANLHLAPIQQHILFAAIALTNEDARSLFTRHDDDVVVNWAGKLEVNPLEQKPEMLAGPNDFSFRLRGPMRLTTMKEDLIIHAQLMEYFHNAARLRLASINQNPIAFNAQAWGVMHTNELIVDVAEERAIFHGKGDWKSHGERNVIADLNPAGNFAGRYDRLPPGTAMSWHDRLVVSFYMDENAGGENSKPGSLGDIQAIKRARFHGDVNIYHPDFDLRGDMLTAGLDPPDASTGRQRLSDLNAMGNIHVLSHADKPEDQLNMRSNELIIGLETLENGDLRPNEVLARGDVHARQRDLSLLAGELLVELDTADDELTLKPSSRSKSTTKVNYKRVIASQDVHVEIELSDDTVEIGATKLIVEDDQVEFFGERGDPATMGTSKGMLISNHFVLDQIKETLHAMGKGTFDIYASVLDEESDPRFADRKLLLSTTWRDNMHYDNLNNYVQFIGNVLARSKRNNSTMQLRGDDLRLDITTNKKETQKPANGEKSLLSRGDRSLQRIAVHGSAQFIAANWGQFGNDRPETRVTIEGPMLTFDSATERVQVLGQGRMGIEDYREKTAEQSTSEDPLAQVSGRGATLFTWKDQLNLDFRYNDMLILDQVQMLHVPLGSDKSVQVDCHRLVADLADTGGLNVLQHTKPDHVDLREVKADGNVRVLGYDHEIYTDHLDYTHYDQTMLLHGDLGNDTRVIDTSAGMTSLRVRKIKWDLQQNRFEIIDMGRGTIPIQRR